MPERAIWRARTGQSVRFLLPVAIPSADMQASVVVQELMNEPMRRLRDAAADLIKVDQLNTELREYLDEGVTLEDGCVYLSRELAVNSHLSRKKMGALGHQSLVNKLHLEDYLEEETPVRWDLWCVAQGVIFARAVLDAVAVLTSLPVDVVLTLDQGGTAPPGAERSTVSFNQDTEDFNVSVPSSTIRFYVRRDGDRWIDDDAIDEMFDVIMIVRA